MELDLQAIEKVGVSYKIVRLAVYCKGFISNRRISIRPIGGTTEIPACDSQYSVALALGLPGRPRAGNGKAKES
jgi:hypothetical protein